MKHIFTNKKFILGSIFCSMLILNILVPLICDDYFYSFVFRSSKRINNILDIAYSEYLHYFNWGGRVLAHSLAQLFLIMPKIVFDICNSFMYTLEIYLIYLIVRNNRKDNYIYLLIIHAFLWFFNCSYGEVNFWLVGSCNYLWTTVIVLLLVYQYIRDDKKGNTKGEVAFNAFFGLLAGMCNENLSFSLIVMLFLIIIFMRKRKTSDIVGLIFAILGYLFLVLAPGNFSRLSSNDQGISFMSLLLKLLFLFKKFYIIFLLLILALYIYSKKNSIKKELIIYFFGILICCCWMIISPEFSLRTLTGCVVFIIIIITYMLYECKWSKKYLYLILIPFIVSYVVTFFDMYKLHSYWRGFEERVEVAKKSKLSVVNYPHFSSHNSHVPGSYDLSLIDCDFNTDKNRYMALFYEIDKVVGRGNNCDQEK